MIRRILLLKWYSSWLNALHFAHFNHFEIALPCVRTSFCITITNLIARLFIRAAELGMASEHLNRCGHITVTVSDKVLLWGGRGFDSDKVCVYDLTKRVWKYLHTTGEIPPKLSGSCCSIVDGVLYIFGGFVVDVRVNSMYSLDLSVLIWSKITPSSNLPSPRDKFGGWVCEHEVIYFGGYGNSPTSENIREGEFVPNYDEIGPGLSGWNNDLLSFDTISKTWKSLPHSVTSTPLPRAAHQCVKISSNEGFLFGGRHKNRRMNDLYSLSLTTNTWCRVKLSRDLPEGRSFHSVTVLDSTNMFVYGGYNTDSEVLGDAWVISTCSKQCREILYERNVEGRMWHTACRGLYDGEVLIFGGCCYFPVIYEHVKYFQLSPLPLKQIALEAICHHKESCGSWNDLPNEMQNAIRRKLEERVK